MAPCFYRVVKSKVLEFLVGPDHEEVVIHSDVLRYNSSLWFDADSGDFAAENLFVIQDVDMRIFSHVCEFLYTGDYSVALPNNSPPLSKTTLSGQNHAEQQALILKGTVFEGPESVKVFADYVIRRIEPRPSEGSQGSHHFALDYTEALLTHARLHVFASKYKMEELRDVCLFKLLHLLHVFPLHDRRVGDIIELFRFVFVTDPEMCGNMKELLYHYVARHLRLFLCNGEFQKLLRDQPSMTTDLLLTLGSFF